MELELRSGRAYHSNVLALNTATNCLKIVVRDFRPKTVYLPAYLCDVVLKAFDVGEVEIRHYSINEEFEPELKQGFSLGESDIFLYVNYFGLNAKNVENLCARFHANLVVDNVQAFFCKPLKNLATFYSLRKFFGVPDGALLRYSLGRQYDLERDISTDRLRHLTKRIELGPEAGYNDFIANERRLAESQPKWMSSLTSRIMNAIDYEFVMDRRNQNYRVLHQALKSRNMLPALPEEPHAPLCYPFLIEDGNGLREYLNRNRIYTATYWPKVISLENLNEFEVFLRDNLVCLPIDQRYDIEDMQLILKLIAQF